MERIKRKLTKINTTKYWQLVEYVKISLLINNNEQFQIQKQQSIWKIVIKKNSLWSDLHPNRSTINSFLS